MNEDSQQPPYTPNDDARSSAEHTGSRAADGEGQATAGNYGQYSNNYGQYTQPGFGNGSDQHSTQNGGDWQGYSQQNNAQTGGAQFSYGNQQGAYQQPGQQFPGGKPPEYDAYGNLIPGDAKTISLLSHLSSVVLYIITASTLSFVGPLIFWMIYKDKPGYAFVAANSARAFNFNLTIWIVNIACIILTFLTLGIGALVTIPVLIVAGVLVFVFHIIGAVKSSRGEVYDYPMQIRVLKD